jgi:hypothetical protein
MHVHMQYMHVCAYMHVNGYVYVYAYAHAHGYISRMLTHNDTLCFSLSHTHTLSLSLSLSLSLTHTAFPHVYEKIITKPGKL